MVDHEQLGRSLAEVFMSKDSIAFTKTMCAFHEHVAGYGKKGRNARLAAGLLSWLRCNVRVGEFVPTSRVAGVLSELAGTPVNVESAGCLVRDLLRKGLLPGLEQHHSRCGNGVFLMPKEKDE
jgi:hypothetical protein